MDLADRLRQLENGAWASSFPLFPKSKGGGFELLPWEAGWGEILGSYKKSCPPAKGKTEGDPVSCQGVAK